MFNIFVDPLLLELTVSDLARRMEATETQLTQALGRISALEEQLAIKQPPHMQDTVYIPASTGASVYPPTPTRTTIHLPKPPCATVHPTSGPATDLPPSTTYSTATSTPVLAGTHKAQVDVSTPAPPCVQQLSCSPFPSAINLPEIYEGCGSSNSPLEIADGYSPYEPSNYPADFYTSPTQGS